MTEEIIPPPPKLAAVKSLHGYMSTNLQCCGNCNAFRADPSRPTSHTGLCCAHPPTVFMSQGMGMGVGGPQPTMQLQGASPPTEKRRWCREWQPVMEDVTDAGTATQDQ